MAWLKEKWVWLVGGLGVVLAALLAIVTFGRRSKQRTAPEAPVLPDVVVTKIPTVDTDFNDTPSDDYEDKKDSVQLPTSPDGVMDSLNSRFE